MNSLGRFGEDCSFYKDEPYRDYQPHFGIENQDEKTTWLTDHGRRVALVYKPHNIIDLFEFFPGQPRQANPQLPAIYHAPSMLGARITLSQWVGAQGRTSDTYDLSIEEKPERITLTITETWKKNRQHSVKRVALAVHPRFGYVLHTDDTIRADEPVGIELYNFLVKGITHHHPAKRRYPYVVWRSARNGVLKWMSNMVSLLCPGQRDYEGTRNLGTDGWVGFFGETDWNPLFAFQETSSPCSIATCDNLLDEHLCFYPSPTAKGAYRLSCRGMLLALPGKVADRIVQSATFNELKPEPLQRQMRPMCLNHLCDFEKPIALDSYFRGLAWRVPENGDEWVTVSDEKAFSGRWALRLRVRPEDGERAIMGHGSTMWLETGKTYRVSAQVCHDGTGASKFQLKTWQGYYSFSEFREPKTATIEANGPTKWQCLELNFTALANEPCGVVQFSVSGDGKWFVDDVLLEEVAR